MFLTRSDAFQGTLRDDVLKDVIAARNNPYVIPEGTPPTCTVLACAFNRCSP
jgi:hypothetical protein